MPRPERLAPVAEFSRAAEVDEVNVDPIEFASENDREIVLKVDENLFFADQAPAEEQTPLELNLLNPPDVSLPPLYEAPSPVVADLAADRRAPALQDAFDRAAPEMIAPQRLDPSPTPELELSQPRSSRPIRKVVPPASEPLVESENRFGVVEEDTLPSREPAKPRSATWPVARRLHEQLDTIETVVRSSSGDDAVGGGEVLMRWVDSVRRVLDRLPASKRLGDDQVADMLDELARLRDVAASHAETLRSANRRVAWLQAAYAIERRLAVWQPIYEINSGSAPATQHVTDDFVSVSSAIRQVREGLRETGDVAGWNQFLLLDELAVAFETGSDSERTEVAQRFLARLTWPKLNSQHEQWLRGDSFRRLAMAIRPWASSAIDYASLLHQIEKAEANAIDLVTAEIAQSMRALRFAGHPKAQELANNLDVHYRNANLRFAISDQLVNQMLPDVPSRNVPVRTTLLGSRVTGISNIRSQIKVRLVPSPDTWKVVLETRGNVSTRSVGRRGAAAVTTASTNRFGASTPITVEPTDVSLGRSMVDVRGGSKLRGVNSDYDAWPLVGSLIRGIAESEYWKKASLSDRIASNRMRSQIGDEIDRDLQQKVDAASDKFSKTVLGPLVNLQLEPKVTDMSTTESRLIARYRMAGDWQLAAMTPRPRAPRSSLLSVQIHQSALNNTLEQLVVQKEPQPIRDLMNQCFELLGIEPASIPDDVPSDVKIQFAKHRPITVEIEDGKVWTTLRVIRLEKGDRLKLRNFIVRASYVPSFEGLHAFLVRDGHLSISGPGMSMRRRLPVRAIFNKVLSPSERLSLTAPNLLADRMPADTVLTQLELRDGWIGLAAGARGVNGAVAKLPYGMRETETR